MSIILSYFKLPAVKMAATIYFIVAGILTQVPLFNYLGYEFSVIISLFASIISGLLVIHFLDDHLKKPLTRRTWFFVLADYIHINFLLLLIPLIVISLNAIVVKNCSFLRGIGFYVLLPLSTMFFSVSLAAVIKIFFRKAKIIFVIAIILLLVQILFIGYTKPQLFAYNFILGYFSGITYDESLHDMKKLLLFREFTAVATLLLFILFFVGFTIVYADKQKRNFFSKILRAWKKERTLAVAGLICSAVLIFGFFFRDELGFEFSPKFIQNELGRRSESEHFIIYYSANDYSPRQMEILKAEAEYHYDLLRERMRVVEEKKKKISVYIFSSSEQKQHFIGTATTNIAKPWLREIHLTVNSFASTFRHELVHVLAAQFGAPIIKASPFMALNEGLAVAMDWNEGMFTLHQYSAALLRDNRISSISSMFTLTGFAVMPSSYAYLVAGSFSNYLIERFGIERFKHLFNNAAFVETYGETLDELVADWSLFLSKINDSQLSKETIQILFSQQSIFQKVCARELAERNTKGAAALSEKNFLEAEMYFRSSFSDAKTAASLRGLMIALMAQNKYNEIVALYTQIDSISILKRNPSVRIMYADALYLLGHANPASTIYLSITNLNITESLSEASAIRQILLEEKIPNEIFVSYFYSETDDSLRVRTIDASLVRFASSEALLYLKAVTLSRMKKKEDAALLFNRFIENDNNMLNYFACIRLASLYYELEQFEDAKMFYWKAKNYAPTFFLKKQIDEYIDLCDYVSLHIN